MNNRMCILLVCLLLPIVLGTQGKAAPAQTFALPSSEVGRFLPAEWDRLAAIQTNLEKTQRLSLADMDYAAYLLRTPPPQSTPQQRLERQRVVLGELTSTRPKVLTPAERRHLFDVVQPYTNSPGVVVRTNAMLVMASSRDPRAVAVLERHVKADPNPLNRTIAANFLAHLRRVLDQSHR